MTNEIPRRRRIPMAGTSGKRRVRRRVPDLDDNGTGPIAITGPETGDEDTTAAVMECAGSPALSDAAAKRPDVDDGESPAVERDTKGRFLPGNAGGPGRPRNGACVAAMSDLQGAGVENLKQRLVSTILNLSKTELKKIVLRAPQPEVLLQSLLSLDTGDGSGGPGGVTVIHTNTPGVEQRRETPAPERDAEPRPSWGGPSAAPADPTPEPEPVDECELPPPTREEREREMIAADNRMLLEDEDVPGTSRRAWRRL